MLTIQTLSALQISKSGEAIRLSRAKKIEALLLYLMLECDRPHPRTTLHALLFPESTEAQARTTFRQTFSRLRKVVPVVPNDPQPYFIADQETIQFNRESDYRLDVHQFCRFAQGCEAHQHNRSAACPACVSAWTEAIALYKGAFLADFYLPENGAFNNWAAEYRETLRQTFIETVGRLRDYHYERNEYEEAIRYARQSVSVDAWDEEAHRMLLRLLGQNGQRNRAIVHYNQLRDLLLEELGVEPDEETAALIDQIKRTSGTRPHNLPPRTSSFIGRQADRATLHTALSDPTKRLITIMGGGGMGKTTLALEVARDVAEQKIGAFMHGVYFVSLVEVETADLLPTTIASALNIPLQGRLDAEKELFDAVAQDEILLVLDNFEQLVETAIPFLSRLINGTRHLKLIITSRIHISLRQAWTYKLRGLSTNLATLSSNKIHKTGSPIWLDPHHHAALMLFLERAQQVNHELAFETSDPAEQTDMLDLCQMVDGLPLALELAASWVRVLSCVEIAAEIQNNIDILENQDHDVPDRHRNVRAVFIQSWALLPAAIQHLLANLSQFPSDFSWDAAQTIADGTRPQLATLIDHSLIQRAGQRRYQLHPLVRQFARENRTETDRLKARYADYYLQWFVALGEKRWLNKTEIERVTAEQDHIIQAWNIATTHNQIDLLRSAHQLLLYYYLLRGLYNVGVTHFRETISQLETKTDDDTVRLVAYLRLASINFFATDDKPYDIQQQCTQARATAQKIGDADLLAACNLNEGSVITHDLDASYEFLSAAHTYFQAENHTVDTAEACLELGIISHQKLALSEAISWFEQGITTAQSVGHKPIEAKCLWRLANVFVRQGKHEDAQQYAKQALDLSYELDDRLNRSNILNLLGQTAMLAHQYTVAEQYLDEACALNHRLDVKWSALFSRWFLGFTQLQLGLHTESESNLENALQMARQLEQRTTKRWEAAVLADLAYLYLMTERPEQGRTASESAIVLACEAGYDIAQIDGLLTLGKTEVALGEYNVARQTFERALQIAQQSDSAPHQCTAQVGIAYANLLLDNRPEAREMLAQPLTHYQNGITAMAKPFWVYLTMYTVLSRLEDDAAEDDAANKEAAVVLEAGYRALEEVAVQIPESRRTLFYENMSAHKQLKQLYERV